jgi:chloramphenicol-sensitive protein RarD
MVAYVPALEMLALRIVWAAVFMAVAVSIIGRWDKLWRLLRDRRNGAILIATASLLAVNWLVFIWAVANDRVVQCSLGFFMTPLVNVTLGTLVLRERLRARQTAAVGLAAIAVLLLAIGFGGIPWIALTLAVSFGLYGLLRKIRTIETISAVTIEQVLLTPVALAYLAYLLSATGTEAFVADDWSGRALLAFSGVLTAVPLLWFAAAAHRLPLSTVGLLQYLAPSVQLALGVLLWGEPFTMMYAVAFGLIWLALGLYTVDLLQLRHGLAKTDAYSRAMR